MAYSQGFSPRIKVHFGLALPTGAESLAEYRTVDLRADIEDHPLADLPGQLTGALPAGIVASTVAPIPTGTKSLQEAVTSATWSVILTGGDRSLLTAAVDRLLAADELMMTRQRKGSDVTDDIRPYLIDLQIAETSAASQELTLLAELGTRPRGLRPSELVLALGEPFGEGRICRTHQWMQQDGARQEPLPDLAPTAPHAELRAS